MNLRGSSPSAQRSFSNDVLKIEVAGPDQQHLSVIDVPGIFRKVTPGITSPEDIPNIKNMVQQYMENPRSVILAVISANVDIANQEILDMAERCDPDGQRTLGVLTKPDLIDRGAEGSVLDLLLGTAHKLNLGWSMVKNPGQEDLNREDEIDRHSVERAFFRTKAPWCTVDKDRVGTDSLRLRLVELLTEIVRKEFNNVGLLCSSMFAIGSSEAFRRRYPASGSLYVAGPHGCQSSFEDQRKKAGGSGT